MITIDEVINSPEMTPEEVIQAIEKERRAKIKHLSQVEKEQGRKLLAEVLALPKGSERDARAKALVDGVLKQLGGVGSKDFNQRIVKVIKKRDKVRKPRKYLTGSAALLQLVIEQRRQDSPRSIK